MGGRGLRSDIRRAGYESILDAKPVGDRGALRDAAGPAAETEYERDRREKRKPCRVFRTSGRSETLCERCNFDYPTHRRAIIGQ